MLAYIVGQLSLPVLPKAEIVIGDNVGISGTTIYARKRIEICENTCIGGNCKIMDNDFHPIDTADRLKLLLDVQGGDSELIPSKEIYIGEKLFYRMQHNNS